MSRARGVTRLALAWVPAALVMAVIFWLSAQPGRAFASDLLIDVVVKKVSHVAGYAILGVVLALAIERSVGRPGRPGEALGRTALLAAWAVATAYAITDELHQVFVRARTPSVLDVGIDALGAAAGIALLAWRRRRRPAA